MEAIKEILGNVTILKCEREKPLKSCPHCTNHRQFLAICQPCCHELCTNCLDFQYDSENDEMFLFHCPTCLVPVTDVKYE